MKVKILEVALNELKDAVIKKGEAGKLPSIQDDWRFNFDKRLKEISGATAYILVAEETPKVIEGCIIFHLKEKQMPRMAYIEIAPHNRGNDKKYEYVAGCLVAYAFRLGRKQAKGDYRGMLLLDIEEENEEDTIKLMANYSQKYKAQRIGDTNTMIIESDDGDDLVETYLGKE